MDDSLKNTTDEDLRQIAGGANASAFVSKFKVRDHVRSLSHPELGEGMIRHMGRLSDGTIEYSVDFGDESLRLPEDDLIPA